MIKKMVQTVGIAALVMAMWSCGEGQMGADGSAWNAPDQDGAPMEMAVSDATGVNTKIGAKGLPGLYTYSTSAKFSFSCTASSCTYKCSLDGAAYKSCSSPKSYKNLVPGGHLFVVKATAAGKTDKTPASFNWMINQDSWELNPASKVPSPRINHTAVWNSGSSSMIIWGGYNGSTKLNTGAKFSPTTNTWTPISTTNAPSARDGHTAVWDLNNSQMIVWGGDDGSVVNTGGKYNSSTNSWTATTTTNAPGGRTFHSAVYGYDYGMVVWGGWNGSSDVNSGAVYAPFTDAWTPMTTTNAPEARQGPSAAWAGSTHGFMVWGGWNGSAALNTGGIYNPTYHIWTAMSTVNAPSARSEQMSAFIGESWIIWGGYDGGNYLNTGGVYDVESDSWSIMPTLNAPSARSGAATAEDGYNFIVWGGYNGSYRVQTGGKYQFRIGTWTDTSTINTLSPREGASAVWDNAHQQVLIWGGYDGTNYLNNGGKYTP